MRTQEEILERIREVKDKDIFGFEWQSLADYLDYENVKPLIKEDVTRDKWKKETRTPKEVMIEYMPFAWDKANNKRGLSAGRSIYHYKAWLWLDGNDKLSEDIEHYNYYGKPQLIEICEEICEYLGIDHKQYDDGVRENN